ATKSWISMGGTSMKLTVSHKLCGFVFVCLILCPGLAPAYESSIDRVIPIVGLAETDGYTVANLDVWSAPIKLDANWNQGDYYGKTEPFDGLATAFKIVVHEAQHYGGVTKTVGRKWAQEGKDPARSWDNKYLAETTLEGVGKILATVSDANSFLYQAKA